MLKLQELKKGRPGIINNYDTRRIMLMSASVKLQLQINYNNHRFKIVILHFCEYIGWASSDRPNFNYLFWFNNFKIIPVINDVLLLIMLSSYMFPN